MSKDNIIDFNRQKKRKGSLPGNQPIADDRIQASARGISEALVQHFSILPQNELLRATGNYVVEKVSMLIMLGFVATKVSEVLESAGLDPNNFTVDEDSLDLFMDLEETEVDVEAFMKAVSENDESALELLWNGPYYDWNMETGMTYRAATTIFKQAMGEFGLSIDLLRIGEDDDNWQIYNDGLWLDGPSEGFFEYLEARREGWFDDDFSDEDDEDWDDEDWENSIDSMLLSANITSALHGAGIDTIDALKKLTDAELFAIKGIGRKSIQNIREALEIEDD